MTQKAQQRAATTNGMIFLEAKLGDFFSLYKLFDSLET